MKWTLQVFRVQLVLNPADKSPK
uniref:Uncharacterized protein n=1 Tax=Anguilla anguilla TaxID=7936 RepID=A0A0E9UC96_ANGAN